MKHIILVFAAVLFVPLTALRADDSSKPLQVFILAGQSNMEGQAVSDLTGKHYNGGRGTLNALLDDPAKAPLVRQLRAADGNWTVRDDVWCRYKRERGLLLFGPLSMGFSVYGDSHHFGPELQFGHVLGDDFDNPVLLIKTAWGGKSLYKDFRPPSSGGEIGPYYTKMIAEVREALANLKTDFPSYAGSYELAGFVWYHGWNDGVDPKNAVPEYEQNLVNLINDVRKEFNAPQLPVVVGEITGPWVEAPGAWNTLRQAQAAAAARPEFNGNVLFVETHDFVRRPEDSPNPGHGHHEFGNAETYFLVGDALGKGMTSLLALQRSTAANDAKLKPNVLLIIADDLRDHIGCYGNTVVQTPNIDRLAERGVLFERAYVQYPVCNPSRSSFLSGLRCDQTGVTDNRTLLRDKLPDVVTFPQLLKENGWYSAAYGKIFHLGGGRNAALKSRWMDLPKSWHEARAFEATQPGKRAVEGRNLTGGTLKWCHWGMMDGRDSDQPDGQIAAAAIEAMQRCRDQPWIIGAGFMKPHDPFLAPREYFDLYPPQKLALSRDPPDITPAPPMAVGFGGFGRAFDAFTDQERLEFLRAYYACISFMDAQLGRVLDEIDRLGLWDETVVIFMSDHGYHLGERNWWNKNTLFDRSCRTPLIIAAPGVKPGRARGLVEFVDLYPTIADYCSVKRPAGLPGTSLRPMLDDPTLPGKSAAFTIVTRGPQLRADSVRTDRWRFTQWSDGAQELYDHDNDAEENYNVAKANPTVVAMLAARLKNPPPDEFDP